MTSSGIISPRAPEAALSPLTKLGYQPALDGLRAVAIGLVLLEHTGLHLFDGGNSGVIIFFVLSGFLITKLMIEEWGRTDTVDVKAFYLRRTIRIFPAPLVMILILFLLRDSFVPDGPQQHYFIQELIYAGLYITNMRPLWGGVPAYVEDTYLSHTWSLAVEEHFYLVWPWVVHWFKLPVHPVLAMMRALLWFAAAITIARQVLYYVFPDLVSVALFTFDSFALGAALAFAVHHGVWQRVLRPLIGQRWFWLACGVLVADLTLRQFNEDDHYAYITYVSLASIVMIGHLIVNQEGLGHRILAWGPIVYLGKLSYSVYLWHVPIMVYFSADRFPDWSLVQIVLVEWTVTAVASVVSYHIVELPLVSLRKRFSKV